MVQVMNIITIAPYMVQGGSVMAECNRVDDSSKPPQGGHCDVDFIDPPHDSLQCPICLSTLKQPHLLSLRVRCSKDGCDWEGELGDLERHLSDNCLYVKEVCPHGCGHLYPRHLLQTHQLDDCPQRPLHLQFESVERRLTQKYELLQQQLLERLEQERKHEEDKELQEKLIQQEQKYKEDKNEL